MCDDVVAIPLNDFIERIAQSASVLLEYYEEEGFHHQEEITNFLMMVSSTILHRPELLVEIDLQPYTKTEEQ